MVHFLFTTTIPPGIAIQGVCPMAAASKKRVPGARLLCSLLLRSLSFCSHSGSRQSLLRSFSLCTLLLLSLGQAMLSRKPAHPLRGSIVYPSRFLLRTIKFRPWPSDKPPRPSRTRVDTRGSLFGHAAQARHPRRSQPRGDTTGAARDPANPLESHL